MFNIWTENSQIELLLDGVQISMVYMKEGSFRTNNANTIKIINGLCSNLAINNNFYNLRTEQIINIANPNPTFTFKSSQDLWSIRDIYVDIIDCSLYCFTCLDDLNCATCQVGYYLYKGQCIQVCPEYSNISGINCIDFDEETQYTSYLIKAFYSMQSQDTETSLFNLISSSGNNFQKGNSIYFSYLYDRKIFGGALVWLNAKFANAYSIPQAHYGVRVRMLVILGDDFGNGQFQYQLNTNSIVTLNRLSPSTSHSQQWGDIQDEYFYQVNTLVPHTSNSFPITVECIGDTSKEINQAFCGIANYFVTVLECQRFCNACTDILNCTFWLTICDLGYSLSQEDNICYPICGDGIIVQEEQCDDGNLIPFDGCYLCQYSCQESCKQCDFGLCYQCQTGWILQEQTGQCLPNCGDGIINGQEECDDMNSFPFDGCFDCQFQCEQTCTDCHYGVCYECNTQGFEVIDNHCLPVCGDSLVLVTEDCDDGNLIPYDGCYECQFQCEKPCTDCQHGICFECTTLGYEFIFGHCLPICGDSLIIGDEECDDGNLIPYDGCYECHISCPQYCLTCIQQMCYQCASNWILIDNQCSPLCGDQIVIPEYEECDDGNLIPYDGCYECSYQCQLECTDCRLGICYDCDTIGWELQINSGISECYPICGDGRITGNEECDDPDDSGCQDCKYICHEQCLDCNWGICFTCAPGWYNIDSQCYSVCGDGYKVGNEECDDFNLVDLDGCSSNCEIEASQACEISNHQSVCSHIVVPSFKLEHEFNQSATQYIKIEFTNEMRKYCDFTFNIEIDGCEDNSYAIQNTSLVPAQFNKLQNVTELIEINFNSSCVRPKVTISLNNTQCLANFYKQQVYPPTDQIIIQQINLISDYSRDKAILMGEVNNYMFYAFLGLMGLSLFTGGLDLMWNMLDLLQYFSFMRLINVSFPKNLDLYFESFEQVSIQPLFKALRTDDLIDLLTGGVGLPYIQCDYKFSEINGLFIENSKQVIQVLIISCIMYGIQRAIFKQLNNISMQFIINLKLPFANYFRLTTQLLYSSIKYFYSSLLLRILMGSAYDINFSIFLQLANFNLQTLFFAFNSIFSIITLSGYLIIVYQLFQYHGKKYPPLFEGIQHKSLWSREFNCVQLLKKTIFIFFLVFFSAEPIIQTVLISMLSLNNIAYIYLTNPFINKLEYFKMILSEGVFCFCSLTFVFYQINVSVKQIYTDEIYQIFGWVHIAMISIILSTNLVIDIKQQICQIIKHFRKKKISQQTSDSKQIQSRLFF